MGTDTSSKLLLGYEYDFLIQNEDEITLDPNFHRENDTISDYLVGSLDYASPYFDADYESCVWGADVLESRMYFCCEVKDDLPELTHTATKHLIKVLGKEFVNKYPPKLYLSAHVI